MLVDTAIYWLVGMPVVAAAISSACQEIHMSKNDTRQFWLEGTGCHEPGSNDKYLGKIELGTCIGMNPDTSKLEWKRFGSAGDYCVGCVAKKTDDNHSSLACRCAGSAAGFDPNSPGAVTSSLDLDAGLAYSKQQFWCIFPKRRSISQPRKVKADASISANCGDIRMSENIATNFAIEANCHNPGGTSVFAAKLDLNACITVDKDAKLVWGSGHAGDLCTGCIAGKADINKSYITCRCALNGDTQSASGVTSTLELDAGIKVDDGRLWCDPVFRRDNNIIPSVPALAPRSTEIFTNICSDVTLADGEELRANCGSTASLAVLDLNKCIGFNRHTKKMEWVPHGKIDDVCKYCDVSLGGKVFACQCGGLGLEHVAFLGLDEGISYKNGALYCHAV